MTPVPGPLILLVLPLLAATVTFAVRRWTTLAALIATATTGVLAILCVRLPLDRSAFVLGQEVAFGRPVVIAGRELVLTPAGQTWLAFLFILTTVFYLFSWRISQGRSFFTFSLAILTLYALVVLLQTFSLAVLVFAISATVAVFMIQSGLHTLVRGAQRYLLITLLAVPLLLIAAWFTDQSLLGPDIAQMAHRALLPAVLGFGLLLAVFPFGTWMPVLAVNTPPIVTAFIFTAGQGMVLFLLLMFVRDAPWILTDPAMPAVIQLSGLVMVVSGGVMAAAQHDFGRLFGYAVLSDLGYLLLALVAGGSQGRVLVLLHTVHRSVSVTLLATALAIVRQQAKTDEFAGLSGLARQLPIATMGLMIGGLALAGFPITAGFPTHWAVSRVVWNWAQPLANLAQEASAGAGSLLGSRWIGVGALAILAASSLGIAVGMLRGLSAMLGSDRRDDVARQPRIASLLVLILIGLAMVLGLYPQLVLEPALATAHGLSGF